MKQKRRALVPLRLLTTFLLFGSVGSFILGQEVGHNFSIVPVYAAQSFMFSGAGITAALTTPIQATGALGSPTPTIPAKSHPQVKPPSKPPVNRPPAKLTTTAPAPSRQPGVLPGSPNTSAPAPTPIASVPATPPSPRCDSSPCGPGLNPVSPGRLPPDQTGQASDRTPAPVAPDDSTGPTHAPGAHEQDPSHLAAPASAGEGAANVVACPASGPAPAALVSGAGASSPSVTAGLAPTTPCPAPKAASNVVGSTPLSTGSSNTSGAKNKPATHVVTPSPAPVTPDAPVTPAATTIQAAPIQTPAQQGAAPVTSAQPDEPTRQIDQAAATSAPHGDHSEQDSQ